MELFVNKIISSMIQIVLFALLPFIWWMITARKKCNFFHWSGLKKPDRCSENHLLLWTAGTLAGFLVLSVFILSLVRGVETAVTEFAGAGASAIPAVIVYSFFNTSLPEELLFRGFLLKRISARFGFAAGNTVQAVLFGLLHGVMFFSITGTLTALLIIVFTGGIGWCMGWINEKKANGSILPGWVIHGISNLFSGICSAFLLI